MIDEKILIEQFEEFYDENEFEINSGFIETCIDFTKDLASEHNNGWISVVDRLPEDNGESVLVTTGNGILFIAVYEPEEKLWWHFDYEYMMDVIAWMPLPEAYRKEKDV